MPKHHQKLHPTPSDPSPPPLPQRCPSAFIWVRANLWRSQQIALSCFASRSQIWSLGRLRRWTKSAGAGPWTLMVSILWWFGASESCPCWFFVYDFVRRGGLPGMRHLCFNHSSVHWCLGPFCFRLLRWLHCWSHRRLLIPGSGLHLILVKFLEIWCLFHLFDLLLGASENHPVWWSFFHRLFLSCLFASQLCPVMHAATA